MNHLGLHITCREEDLSPYVGPTRVIARTNRPIFPTLSQLKTSWTRPMESGDNPDMEPLDIEMGNEATEMREDATEMEVVKV